MKNGEWGTMRKFEMYLARDQTSLDKPLDGMGNFREVHENPLSEGCIERVKEMLDLCLQAHPMCNPTPSAYLPARVIDIGTDTSAPKLCALVLKKVNYVTLSHCWGAFQPLTTTKATLAERQEGIDWDALPKTFQEAIKLTRILGIRYIWIDSLCIVQDDRDDWETEAMKMGEIYRNAYLTIAASLSRVGSEGFLKPRTSHISKELIVNHPQFPKGSAKFRVRAALAQSSHLTAADGHSKRNSSPEGFFLSALKSSSGIVWLAVTVSAARDTEASGATAGTFGMPVHGKCT
ncbi:HET-domain-containing protein [Glonium stellatum]|uniref:HET-domain-containing protein n=1 Tax=Glonium stellatum TaxID=574774 RepID=A0A8E2F2Y5_9PEZI|nr:HET-domain-containing protein [Glonium stellatum]